MMALWCGGAASAVLVTGMLLLIWAEHRDLDTRASDTTARTTG